MMGDAAGLPLPSASPAPAALPVSSASGAAAARVAAVAAGQDPAAPAVADASALFDLLMGGQQDAAAMALPGAATRAAASDRQQELPVADPLLSVLAQMPQMTQPTPLPAAPAPALPPVAAADTAGAAAAASILALPSAGVTAGQGMFLPASDTDTSAAAAVANGCSAATAT